MAASPCLIILTVKLVIQLTTVTSSPLTNMLVLRPIDDEIRNAVDELDLRDKTKDTLLEQYINVGSYSNDFIELLNTYNTFKDSPIIFTEDEKRILTTSNTEDSLNDKVLAQLKYYRKIQEIQCADYLILQYILYGTEPNIEEIAKYVYNMIAMAYKGKVVAFKWLWELYINLLSPTTDDGKQPLNMMMQDFENFQKPLADLIEMCVEHKYITVKYNDQQNHDRRKSTPHLKNKLVGYLKLNIKKYRHYEPMLEESSSRPNLIVNTEETWKLNYEKHELFKKNSPALPLSFDHLSLKCVWEYTPFLIDPIPNVTIDWTAIEKTYAFDLQTVQTCGFTNWKKYPFEYIRFQKSFRDIIMIKLYCYIYVLISVYNPSDYIFNGYLKSLIVDMLKFSYIEDKTLNNVITLYNKFGKLDDSNENDIRIKIISKEQIDEVLKIITDEVNKILSNLIIGYTNKTKLADLSDIKTPSCSHFEVLLNRQSDDSKYLLMKIDNHLTEFNRWFERGLDGLTLDVLSFFIDASKNTYLSVFPEN
ncbi:uncharacterized protein LOC126844081 isoform X1 [Adelges cooleyi]|uniref:uncharacterized protein LOC126844081 isoform X1 n=1 Tax=Adelges cooleyi TaxID=133065 RepID=UPI0021806A39|nr:uncharacterized protein LOC126844081 isoform X1 [Adelges cooleyi]